MLLIYQVKRRPKYVCIQQIESRLYFDVDLLQYCITNPISDIIILLFYLYTK